MSKLKRNDKFTFGKHKGKTIGHILNEQPTYIWWCIHNISWFNVEDNIKEIADKAKEIEDEERYEHYQDMYGVIDPYDFCF